LPRDFQLKKYSIAEVGRLALSAVEGEQGAGSRGDKKQIWS